MTASPLPPGRVSRRGRRGLIAAAAVALTAVMVAGFRVLVPEESSQVATFPVTQGEFRITLRLANGELEAVNAEQINAPQVRGQLKITKLFPEGETVAIGDLVIEFDKAEFAKRVTEAGQALEASRAEIEKTMANQKVEIGRQQSDIHNKEAELRLAELKLKKMEFESLIDKEETRLQVRQSELALEQAHRKFEAQKIVDKAEKKKQELDVAQKERGLVKAEKRSARPLGPCRQARPRRLREDLEGLPSRENQGWRRALERRHPGYASRPDGDAGEDLGQRGRRRQARGRPAGQRRARRPARAFVFAARSPGSPPWATRRKGTRTSRSSTPSSASRGRTCA